MAGDCQGPFGLERHLIGTFEREHLAGLIGRGDLVAEVLQDPPDLDDLLRIASGYLASAQVDAVLKPHTNIGPLNRRVCEQAHLVAAGPQHGPVIEIGRAHV